MVGLHRDRPAQRFDPCFEALERDRVDEVDADVRHPHLPRQAEGLDGLRGVGLALEHGESAPVETLNAEAQAVDPTLEPRRDFRLIGACGVRLQGHLRIRRDVEGAADEREQPRHQLRLQQAGRPPAEIDRVELLERIPLAGEDQLALQRIDVVGHEAVHPRVRVEVAVAALVLAEGNVYVEMMEGSQWSSPFMGRSARLVERARTGVARHFLIV